MMISRALFIALFSAYVTSLAPLVAPGDDDCALYLTGPGRSSAYDYSLNLLKGNFAYDGQHTCITYDAINQAYLDARTRILVSQPKGDWHAEDFASVGELILDISTNLARTYGLTYEEIEKGLPLIDTSRTLIREVCPPVFSHVECRAGKYRRLDGLCNNLQHPTWGATMAPFQRLIGPLFADGINAPRISHSGRDLPLSRVVSRTMHPDDGFHDHAGTVMVIAWGQFMDHDYTLTGTPLDPINRNDPEECCKRPPHLKHPYCNEIRIPDDDYFYRLFGVKCIDFVRGFPSPRPGCKLGSRTPFNTLTGAIDGNTVYGVTEKFARKLRTGYGGLLRMNPVFKEYGLKDLLPLKLDIPDEGCTRPNKNMYCFEAGEIRVNEQLVLTVMHTLMAREHNRVAKALAEVNPHWDDETLFQEARRINIAEIQHITYNEFLPILLGKDVMEKFGLVLEKDGYWNGYDPEVNPDVIASFAAAAYRFGHSLLPTAVERWSKAHKFIASKRLSDLIRRPYDLYRAGVLDEYVMGLMNQVAQAMDDSITQEVTNHLFKKVGARFGMDLVSFNMQRGREFGLPGYMEFRKFCGLSDAHTFLDLYGSMPNETLRKYESIFEHPIDIDLWSGGVSERPLRGSMLGPTFACIIATQFSYSRRGDRFWFELPNQPSSFTPEQLTEIRKSRLARVICDNTDIIDTVQLYPMVLPDHELNPRVPCRSGIIPSMDFSKWAEPVPFGPAKQYITDAIIEYKLVNNTKNDTINCVNSTQCDMNITNHSNINEKCNEVENDNNNKIPDLDSNINSTASQQINSDRLNINKTSFEELKSSKNRVIKDNKGQISHKTKGHKSNSLRKKRFAPAVYNYVTNHDVDSNEKLEPEGVVNTANLANFNIKTTHEPYKSDALRDTYIKHKPQHIPVEESASDELKDLSSINERGSQEKDERPESEESLSREIGKGKESSERSDESKTDSFQNHLLNSKEKSSSENLNNDVKKSLPFLHNSDESFINDSNESKENIKNLEPLAIKDNDNRDSYETSENSNSDENFKQEHGAANLKNQDGSNTEQSIKTENDAYNQSNFTQNYKKPIDKYIDESTEQISKESVSTENEFDNANSKIFDKNDSYENSPIDSNIHSNDTTSTNLKTIVNINDGEIKPVIEQNTEDISIETSEELKSSDLKVENPQEKNVGDVENKKVDLKQQFERIPLDYKHVEAESNEHTESPESNNDSFVEKPKEVVAEPSPENVNFDENLNIKFGDISIKLPEIKLPDDILSYNYEEPLYEKVKSKNSYSHEEPDSQRKTYHKNNNNYDYHNNYKENYKHKDASHSGEKEEENDDDDEDLYEKFVRERFGKRRSKEENKSKYITPNEELYKTLQNVLKKTEKIQEEAQKSGDPNAGYAWTLEYGQKL